MENHMIIGTNTNSMNAQIHHRKNSIWIALGPVTFDARAYPGLSDNEIRKCMCIYERCIGLQLLGNQPFEGDVVDVGVEIEELEVDVHETLLDEQ
jgi:hypothetical protein